jgi:hypothetical protein
VHFVVKIEKEIVYRYSITMLQSNLSYEIIYKHFKLCYAQLHHEISK